MSKSMTYTGELTIVECWCGTLHAVPAGLREYQMRQHRDGHQFSIYCPLGHQHAPSGKPMVEIERERCETLDAQLTAALDQLQAAQREAKRQATRARNGVCPKCHRSFANVKRHMDSKHPSHQ